MNRLPAELGLLTNMSTMDGYSNTRRQDCRRQHVVSIVIPWTHQDIPLMMSHTPS